MTNDKTTDFSSWLKSPYAQQYFQCEEVYLKNALRQVSGPCVLVLGDAVDSELIRGIDFPHLITAGIGNQANHSFGPSITPSIPSLLLDPAFLSMQAETVSTAIVPHVLEHHALPHQVLREAHRVLMPEGHIILTGFNPFSIIGLQRLLFKRAACPGQYYTVKRVSDWLQLLGFEIVSSASFAHAPLINNKQLRNIFNFLNPLCDRWLPIIGGGYMITARKKQLTGTLIKPNKRKSKRKKRRRKLVTASSNSKHPST